MGVNINTASQAMIWDSLKAFLRGLLLTKITNIKRKTRKQDLQFANTVQEAEREYIRNPTPLTRSKWCEAQKLDEVRQLNRARRKRFFSKQPYFEEGESTGHLLATVMKSQQPRRILGLYNQLTVL